MNIIILANRDLASNYAVNLLLPHIENHNVQLFLSAKVGGSKNFIDGLDTLNFFEQGLFNQLICPPLENCTSRNSEGKSFDQIADVLQQPVQDLNAINDKNGIEMIKSCSPDLIISIRYGVILKNDIIALPRYGVINLHSGLLPEYRGVMATFWAMLNQEKRIGTTLHYIEDDSIDTGSIIAQSHLSVDTSKSYLWHVLSLYTKGVDLIVDAVKQINIKKRLKTAEQQSTGGYFTFPKASDLNRFREMGLKLFDQQEYVEFIKKHYH